MTWQQCATSVLKILENCKIMRKSCMMLFPFIYIHIIMNVLWGFIAWIRSLKDTRSWQSNKMIFQALLLIDHVARRAHRWPVILNASIMMWFPITLANPVPKVPLNKSRRCWKCKWKQVFASFSFCISAVEKQTFTFRKVQYGQRRFRFTKCFSSTQSLHSNGTTLFLRL